MRPFSSVMNSPLELPTTAPELSVIRKSGEVQTLRFYNAKQGCIVVKKLDKQTGKPLAGVEFQITYADGSSTTPEMRISPLASVL